MIFHPVWVSSTNHMDTFADIVYNASGWQKALGLYTMPPSFPHIVNFIFRLPVVFFAKGTLSIESETVSFTADSPRTLSSKYRNVQTELNFQLAAGAIKSIERYRHPNPFMEHYNIDWVRVRTREDVLAGDFLLCVGGTGPFMGKIRHRTDELHEALVEFTRRTSPTDE